LKNTGPTLPLSSSALADLALIGPGAGQTFATNSGGEAAGGLLSQQTSPLTALQRATKGTGAQIHYAVADDLTGTPVPASALSHDGAPGLLRNDTQVDPQLNFTTKNGNPLPAGSSNTWTGTLTVSATGSYWLNIQSLGATGTLIVDGKTLTTVGGGFGAAPRYGVVHPTDGNAPTATTDGLANGRTYLSLTAGAHTVKVVEAPDVSGRPVQIRLNWVTPAQQQADHDAAVATARSANTAVVFAWATSSGDLSTPLPDQQDQLIADVAAVNPNVVVVLQSGQPIAMPWLDQVKSVLEAWYGGDQAGVAAADVLLGKMNPGGRLPMTWPTSLDQEVAHQPSTHPERTSNGVHADGSLCPPGGFVPDPTCLTTYSEGLNIGYRFYDATGETPQYPFGYGLSYTTFRYSDISTRLRHSGALDVTFQITNTGSVSGDEVPQVYLGAPVTVPTGVQFAKRALAGYVRVALAAGQTKTITVHVPARQLEYWSDSSGWTTASGSRTVYVGPNERSDALSAQITVG
ncbi:MAG TPA: glycoside hydrolase family 3 C-terminal domain-containing protein, partial [Jatrophihabitans sp.]|nr:glycoside hydrolase family 3 C-terminal domain-containing protein [Jatrophihabitans sp.]